ncbi:hypothetical protein D3C77_637250 [compost metagenome]
MNKARRSDSTGNIQLALTVAWQLHMRIRNVTANLTVCIGIRNNLADRPIAFNLNGQLLAALQHSAHHCSRSNSASQSCRRCWISIMAAAQLFHERSRANGKCAHLAVHGRAPN